MEIIRRSGLEFTEYDGDNTKFKGRRTLERNGETLIEGIDFLVDGDYNHLPALDKETAYVGGAYRFCDGYMILKNIRKLSEAELREFQLIYKEQFTAQTYTSGGSFEIGGGLCGSQY